MEQSELIEKMRKFGELIGTLSVVVYTQSCVIETLVLTGFKNQDPELLANAQGINRQALRAAIKNAGIDATNLDELDKTMVQFKKHQEELAKEEVVFKARRATVNREYQRSKEPSNEPK